MFIPPPYRVTMPQATWKKIFHTNKLSHQEARKLWSKIQRDKIAKKNLSNKLRAATRLDQRRKAAADKPKKEWTARTSQASMLSRTFVIFEVLAPFPLHLYVCSCNLLILVNPGRSPKMLCGWGSKNNIAIKSELGAGEVAVIAKECLIFAWWKPGCRSGE